MRSDLNSNAKLMGEIAQVCFLITNETAYEAHFDYGGSYGGAYVRVCPDGDWDSVQLEFRDYLCANTHKGWPGMGHDIGVGKAPMFRQLLKDLKRFLEKARLP